MIEWTEALEDRIAHLLITDSLRTICSKNLDLPSRESIRLHQVESDSFWAKCARARKAHAIQLLEDAGDTASECTENNAQAAKVKISFAQWTAEKLMPRDYGAKLALTDPSGTGPAKLIIEHIGSDGEHAG